MQMRAFAEEGRLSENPQIPPLTETVEAIEVLIRPTAHSPSQRVRS